MAEDNSNNKRVARYTIAAIALFLLFFAQQWWLTSTIQDLVGKSNTTSSRDSVFVYLQDTSTHTHEKNNLQPINNFFYNTEKMIDTASIIKDYFTKNFYSDADGDTLISIKVFDTIYKNRNTYRKITWKFLKPYQVNKTVTVTNTTTVHVNGFYAGPFAGINPVNKTVSNLGISLDYITRRAGFGIGYDFMTTGITGRITIKLGKK